MTSHTARSTFVRMKNCESGPRIHCASMTRQHDWGDWVVSGIQGEHENDWEICMLIRLEDYILYIFIHALNGLGKSWSISNLSAGVMGESVSQLLSYWMHSFICTLDRWSPFQEPEGSKRFSELRYFLRLYWIGHDWAIFNGNFCILKWRYCTIYGHILCWYSLT